MKSRIFFNVVLACFLTGLLPSYASDWRMELIEGWLEGQNANALEEQLASAGAGQEDLFFSHLFRGILLQDRGLYAHAIRSFSLAESAMPPSPVGISLEMLLLYQQILALESIQDFEQQGVKLQRYSQLGFVAREEEESQRFRSRNHPYRRSFQQIYGVWLLRMGRGEESEKQLQSWVEEPHLSPSERRRRNRIFLQHLARNPDVDPETALERKMVLWNEFSGMQANFDRSSLAYSIAGLHMTRGEFSEAMRFWQESSKGFFAASSLHPMERLMRLHMVSTEWDLSWQRLNQAKIWQSRNRPFQLQELFKETRLAEAQLLFLLGFPDRALEFVRRLAANPRRSGFRFETDAQWELELLLTTWLSNRAVYRMQLEHQQATSNRVLSITDRLGYLAEQSFTEEKIRNLVLQIRNDPMTGQLCFFRAFPIPQWMYLDLFDIIGPSGMNSLKRDMGITSAQDQALWDLMHILSAPAAQIREDEIVERLQEATENPGIQPLTNIRLQARASQRTGNSVLYENVLATAPIFLFHERVPIVINADESLPSMKGFFRTGHASFKPGMNGRVSVTSDNRIYLEGIPFTAPGGSNEDDIAQTFIRSALMATQPDFMGK